MKKFFKTHELSIMTMTLSLFMLYFFLGSILSSCGPTREEIVRQALEEDKQNKQAVEWAIAHPIQTTEYAEGIIMKTIDSCEYVLYPQTFIYVTGGAYNSNHIINYTITHKGNCKFCLIRNKK